MRLIPSFFSSLFSLSPPPLLSLSLPFHPTGKGSLIITLLEPGNQSVTISVEVNQIRPLHLVTGRTYHIMCRDDSPHGEFDHSYLNVWWHCGVPVTKLSSTHFPDSDQAAVYSSTQVDVMVANEWTLVLQNLGEQPTEVGVYSCRDLQGRNVSLDIKECKELLFINPFHPIVF